MLAKMIFRSIYGLIYVAVLVVAGSINPLLADELRPSYLELKELPDDLYNVVWKVPAASGGRRLALNVSFSDDVTSVSDVLQGEVGDAYIKQWQVYREGGLADAEVTIDGLITTTTFVLMRIEYLSGVIVTHRITPSTPSYIIEHQQSNLQVAWTYLVIGTEHILMGIDHLLFVLALLLIVKGTRKLIVTITAFTVAHSITLTTVTLGWFSLPGPPVEAVIALSILFVAREIILQQRGIKSITAKRPWLVAFVFGLLHGFGFAGALAEVGLPQNAIPLALLFFNVGVEIGQLFFVAAVVLILWLLKSMNVTFTTSNRLEWGNLTPAYIIGGVAAFWFVERTLAFA